MYKGWFFAVAMAWFMALNAMGQDVVSGARQLIAMGDSLLWKRYYGADIDTNYIQRPDTRWTLRARANISGASIQTTSKTNDAVLTTHQQAAFKTTVNFGLSYMGLSMGLSMNPGLLLGHYKDYEFNINSYGNKVGFDIIYQQAKNFTGWMRYGEEGEKIDLPHDMLTMRTLNMNAYYAFNYRRFSYPAAFSQSYIQRQSAGSFMLAASFQGQTVETNPVESIGNRSIQLRVKNFALGAGYGYNMVLPHRWVLHLSALPTFIVHSRNRLFIDDERQTMPYSFPEVIVTGRGAFVHSFDNYFTGLSMVYTFSSIGSENRLQIRNDKWRARAFIGLRF